MNFSLSSGSANDREQGMLLFFFTPSGEQKQFLLMYRAHSGKKMIETAARLIVPPKKNFKEQWNYDKDLYKRRNEIERFFRRLKAFRRIFTCYDKSDIIWGMIVDSLV
ncbi:MAG: transposase [Selenomonadaceae bacterium]|nr:transposase [Selenomonadaceae bacterium]